MGHDKYNLALLTKANAVMFYYYRIWMYQEQTRDVLRG